MAPRKAVRNAGGDGRSRLLGCLDGTLFEGLSLNRRGLRPRQHGDHEAVGRAARQSPAGWGAIASAGGPRLRRGALAFGSLIAFGRKQHLVARAVEPGADRSSSSGALWAQRPFTNRPACFVESKDLRMN